MKQFALDITKNIGETGINLSEAYDVILKSKILHNNEFTCSKISNSAEEFFQKIFLYKRLIVTVLYKWKEFSETEDYFNYENKKEEFTKFIS